MKYLKLALLLGCINQMAEAISPPTPRPTPVPTPRPAPSPAPRPTPAPSRGGGGKVIPIPTTQAELIQRIASDVAALQQMIEEASE